MILMQDSAPIHTAKKFREWFENQGVMVTKWAPYSPDMNPIENVWHMVKDWIVQHHPELNEMGDSEEAYQALYRDIQEA
jgi:transposase